MSKQGQLQEKVTKYAHVSFQTASILSAIITIISFFGATTIVLAFVVHLLVLLVPGIGILGVNSALFFVFRAFLREKRNTEETLAHVSLSPVLPVERKVIQVPTDTIQFPPPPEEDVEILSKEIVYEYLEDGKTMYQRKHVKIRMLRNGVHSFLDRYRWTGSGPCVVKSLTNGFEVTNLREEDGGIWQFFDVSFSHPYHKDDVVEFTIEWEMVDEDGKAVPFLSTMIDRETKYLLLQVRLPRQLTPIRAYFHEYTNYIDTLPSDTQQIRYNPAARSITYEVNEPKKYRKYQIRWYYD